MRAMARRPETGAEEVAMKVFVAGATGAMGKRLVPQLLAAGHQVAGMTRSERKADWLRTEGTDYLLAGAQAAGTRRFIAQSYGNWNYERTGTGLKTEEDPFDPSPPPNQVKSLAAIRYVEKAVLGAAGIEGVALRYGNFYGPGTGIAADGDIVAQVRKRRFPIVGDGSGVWSFVHMDDAASAAIAALGRGAPGVYNVADDEPAPVAAWLPDLAAAVGAKPPRHVPVWLGRLAAGEVGVSMMTRIPGTSNAKAKAELGWAPQYRT